jgi:microcystin-dependent protein
MGTPLLGEIKICAFNFPPKGWALCNGQLLPINQNQALFSLLGTTYGGDGRVNFALPNLQGKTPIHFDSISFPLGNTGGETSHTLIQSEMPTHNHSAQASSNVADQGSPGSNFWANPGSNVYSSVADSVMAPQAISNAGGSQPHDNMSPYLVLNFCIALQGIFPSRS